MKILCHRLNHNMPEKIFLHLLLLCGIWSPGIIGTFADEEINESLNFLARQKRVINHVPGENNLAAHNRAPYIVAIHRHMSVLCMGNILSNYVAITAAICVEGNPSEYRVLSHAPIPRQGAVHNVSDIRLRIGGHRHRARDGVGLVVVHPPFVYSTYCENIPLHTGPIRQGRNGTVSSWTEMNFGGANHGINRLGSLRRFELPIISNWHCANTYGSHIVISEQDICTSDPQRLFRRTDFGAGLVVENQLVGIFLLSGMVEGYIDPDYPDVFGRLQSSYYHQWIVTNVAMFGAYYRYH